MCVMSHLNFVKSVRNIYSHLFLLNYGDEPENIYSHETAKSAYDKLHDYIWQVTIILTEKLY